MIATPCVPEFDQSLSELRQKMVTADEDQARNINRQILNRLATRIRYLEQEMDFLMRPRASHGSLTTSR